MMFQGSVHAFDMMGQTHVSLTVHEWEDQSQPSSLVLQHVTDVPDDGESDPREWLKGLLIAALESL